MRELETAIWSRYNGSAALKAVLTNGLHNTIVPQSVQEPYAVFQIISGIPRHTFSHVNEDIILQFRIRSKISESSAELNNIFAALTTLYDDAELTISGYDSVMMKRNIYSKSQDDDGIWIYFVQYLIEIEKN